MSDYNHNGHAYLQKINKEEENRQSKLNNDMLNIKDKITDLQKKDNNQLRETFYNCLENKIKDKLNNNGIPGLHNSDIKFENMNISKFSNQEKHNNSHIHHHQMICENDGFNLMNTSGAFNRTKSQFRNTITGSNILSPINEGQQPQSIRFDNNNNTKNMENYDIIKINENRNFETTRVYKTNTGNGDIYESRENPFNKTKRGDSLNPENNSMVREESKDTKLVS